MNTQIYWAKINKIIDETHEIKTFLLECPDGFIWEEGAHTHLGLKGFNEGNKPNKGLVRHMSICTLPHENKVGITTRIKEQCSEFKAILKTLKPGDEVALFKIHSNVPLKRENKNIYLLSQGVGIATFRPLVLKFLESPENIKSVTSLNIESTKQFLFTEIFQSALEKNFSAKYVDNRNDFYGEVEKLAQDQDGIFYIVGSDEFILQNINILRKQSIQDKQMVLDKRERFLSKFFTPETSN